MGHDKNATTELEGRDPQPARSAKKPYAKPVVRRLGSVRELTQTTPSNGK